MRIKKIELKNFKRFTDLTISNILDTSKLVLLIGSNGSGKSSLFDAFDWLSKGHYKGMPYSPTDSTNYYSKNINKESSVLIEFWNNQIIEKKNTGQVKKQPLAKHFLGRSSIRIVPRISNNADIKSVSSDGDSPPTYIEHDTRFINDLFSYIDKINGITTFLVSRY